MAFAIFFNPDDLVGLRPLLAEAGIDITDVGLAPDEHRCVTTGTGEYVCDPDTRTYVVDVMSLTEFIELLGTMDEEVVGHVLKDVRSGAGSKEPWP